MSKDAWIGQDENGEWFGGHDGPCADGAAEAHRGTRYDLRDVMIGIERCIGQSLAWEFREQVNGLRLAGYVAR